MAKLITLTVQEFVAKVRGGVKHHFGGMVGVTVPTLTVKDRNDHSRTWSEAFPSVKKENVRKIMHGAILVGPDYVKMLENELAREGKATEEYTPGAVWHEAVEGSPCLRRHKGTKELYFWVAFVQKRVKKDADGNPVLNSEGRPVYIHLKPKVRYIDISTGAVIPRESLHGFTKIERPPGNQGVDSGCEIIVRCYKLENVRTLVVDGKVYSIITK